MTSTYDTLKSGGLSGTAKLQIRENLKEFPLEILELSDTLEILDLSGNQLSSLPDGFIRLKKLRILFLSENSFTKIPELLSKCPELSMIGFKSNQITDFPENSMPPNLRWLILTDNQIDRLPDSIGRLDKLQKLMLAGNHITHLPDTMQHCVNLELLRISANRLEHLPKWLFAMPKLSWLACAGNPCLSIKVPDAESLAEIAWEDISIHEVLGEGASGIISRGSIRDEERHAAVKVFRGDVTSDGYPSDEMAASIAAGKHHNLNTPHAKISQHPKAKEALIFPLIPSIYCNLGNPPSLESCTRDTYDDEADFPLPLLMRIVSDVTSAALHLHQRGINHGDLYAHNILIDKEGHSLLGDFGAATCYDRTLFGDLFEKLEVRAFGCLLEDLLERSSVADESEGQKIGALKQLKHDCLDTIPKRRPPFSAIKDRLSKLALQA